mgnify:CR=1 FL=1
MKSRHFDEIPIFYFTNHHAVFGEGNFPVLQRHTEKLDFELECAAVIGKGGRNISTSDADDYIAGFMIMNETHKSLFKSILNFYFANQERITWMQNNLGVGTDQPIINFFLNKALYCNLILILKLLDFLIYTL